MNTAAFRTVEDDNSWKTLQTEIKYDNPRICVHEQQVVNPAGNRGIYGVVTFKNRAIGILPLFENGDTLIVGQTRYPLEQYSWKMPMGGARAGEDRLISAQRKLREETGFTYPDSHSTKVYFYPFKCLQ